MNQLVFAQHGTVWQQARRMSESVPLVTLPAVWTAAILALGRVDLLMLDIGGAEARVLTQLPLLPRAQLPLLLLFEHDHHSRQTLSELNAMLIDLGYRWLADLWYADPNLRYGRDVNSQREVATRTRMCTQG